MNDISSTLEALRDEMLSIAQGLLLKDGHLAPVAIIIGAKTNYIFHIDFQSDEEKTAQYHVVIPKILKDVKAKAAIYINEVWFAKGPNLTPTGKVRDRSDKLSGMMIIALEPGGIEVTMYDIEDINNIKLLYRDSDMSKISNNLMRYIIEYFIPESIQ